LILGSVVAFALLVGFLLWWFPGVLSDDEQMSLLYYVILFVFIASSIWVYQRGQIRIARTMGHGAIWLGILIALVLGYAYRFELEGVKDRFLSALMPSQGIEEASGEVRFSAANDGHFYIDARVDGLPVRFLMDTGASRVVLSPEDARRLGFDIAHLDFTQPVQTANGITFSAPIRLGEITVGPIHLRDVPGSINRQPMPNSLLGMSFLERLGGYSIKNDTLTLRP
jgi:aspartyl protease family protein